MNGFFLCLDGVDGGGKSTQVQLLRDWYAQRGMETCLVRDPGGTSLGESVRDILLHRKEIALNLTAEMLLYMASRAQLVSEVIRPALEAGKVVISDRYLLANVVYQGVAGGLDPQLIWQIGAVATGGLQPDLTIILDLDPEVSLRRLGEQPDRLESRGVTYMRQVRAGFLEQSRKLGNHAVIVNAAATVESVHAAIKHAVKERQTIADSPPAPPA